MSFEENIKLVYFVIKKRFSSYKDKEDLIQEGMIALRKAIETFNDKLGIKFSSYAVKCIENQMLSYIKREKRNKIIPFSDIEDNVIANISYPMESSQIDLEYIFNYLKPSERIIILRMLQGKNQQEIAEEFNCSRSWISYKFVKIKGVLREKNVIREICEHG